MDKELEEEFYNMKLYGYHKDDEYYFPEGSEEFNQLHKKIEFIRPIVSKIIEELKINPQKYPSSFFKLGGYPLR